MRIFTKEQIASIILEQVQSVDMSEMARARREDWGNEKLSEPMVIDVPGVSSKDPNTGEIIKDKVISDDVRIAPKGQRVLMFYNQEIKDVRGYAAKFFYDIDRKKVMSALPRNDYYGTSYSPSFDTKTKTIITAKPETSAKRFIFPIIKKLFSEGAISSHLMKCAIPEIVAAAYFTEPTTNVQKTFTFGDVDGNIKFNLHSVQDEADIQTAMDKILDLRMSMSPEEGGEEEGGVGQPVSSSSPRRMVRKYAGNIYPGGEWTPEQRTFSKKHHKLTAIYKLHKKAVQGGDIAFTVQSDLNVIGGVSGSDYTLVLNFSVTKFFRTATQSRGRQKGQIIEPIRVNVTEPLPDGVDTSNDGGQNPQFNVNNYKDFFKSMFINALQQLGNEILKLDPDDALTQLMFDPSDVDADFQNDN
jgi:hypothetical protein